jgi:tetratricopeptide (TPR) repeat protein
MHRVDGFAGIADCFAFLYFYWNSSKTNLEQADQSSRKSLEIDSELAEAHASRGLTASMKKEYEEAEREFRTAIRLGPRLFEPYYYFARNCYPQGRLEDAVVWFEQASKVSPEDYQAPMLLASALNGLGLQPEAVAAYRRGLAAAERHLELHPWGLSCPVFWRECVSPIEGTDQEYGVGGTGASSGGRGTASPLQRGLRLSSAGRGR